MTVGDLLAIAGLPAPEARALLALVLRVRREWLLAHPEHSVAPQAQARFEQLAARRRAGEPLAYLLGRREFHGREFEVGPAVLIPRPETELLVELALAAAARHPEPAVLDLGTGSGCLAVTLALECPAARVTALDLSPAALAVARTNARRLGATVEFIDGDWYLPLAGRRFEVIVANPPYVAAGDPHLQQGDLRYEPALALTDAADGLACLRRVIGGAPAHLAPDGWLGVEHGCDQGAAVRELFATVGFRQVVTVPDAAGLDRVTQGRRAS